MKSKALLLVSVLAVSGLVSLASCGETVEESLYKVTAEAGSGTTISFKDNVTEYHKGDMVTFTVAVTSTDSSQELKTVKFGDTSLAIESDGTYEVAMPDKNVTVTTAMGPVEVTDFKVTTKAGLGSTITLTAGEVTSFAPGSTVEFDVAVENPDTTVLDSVLVGGNEVSGVDGHYTFTMPNKDVEIETVTTVLGDGSLLTPSDVVESTVANITTIDNVTSLLDYSAEHESEFIKGGKVSFDTTERYEDIYEYTYYVSNDDKVIYEGTRAASASTTLNSYIYHETGLYDDTHYYEFSYDSQSDPSITTKPVVADDAPYSSYKIKESEAKTNVSSAGLSEQFSSLLSNLDTVENKEISEDGKYFTLTLSGENVGYADYDIYSATVVFDGDQILSSVDYTHRQYDIDDYNEETGALNENAKETVSDTFKLSTVRGYKEKVVSKFNVKDYAPVDYTVNTTVNFNSENTYLTGGGEINNGSILSFTYRSSELKPLVVEPIAVGIVSDVEGIATVSDNGGTVTVNDVGDFKIVFDNGFGDLLEVEYTSVVPKAQRVNATLEDDTIFVNETTVLTASVNPEQAPQEVSVSVKEDSVGGATIAKNEDGTYTITATKEGLVTLVVTSVDNPEASTEVQLNVVTPPTYDGVYKFMTTTTLHGTIETYYSDYLVYVNFDADGTGEYRIDESSYGSVYKGEVVEFTYTLDQETLAISLTVTGDVTASNRYTIYSLKALTNSTMEVVIDYFGSQEDPGTLTATDSKIDLNA